MSASQAARSGAASRVVKHVRYLVKSGVTIYKYCDVAVDVNGLLTLAGDTVGVGVGYSISETVVGDGSTVYADVIPNANDRYREYDGSNLTQAMIGDLMCYSDDHTVAAASVTTNDLIAGRMIILISSSKCVIDTEDRAP